MNNPKKIELNLPDHIIHSCGELYDTKEKVYLTQDILQIALPDEIYIDVSWYPEHGPDGDYYVTVYSRNWEHKMHEHQTKDIYIVKEFVEKYARMYPVRPL